MTKTYCHRTGHLQQFIIPAITVRPPVTGPHRIAATVDELMALRGQLAAHYASAATGSTLESA